MRKECSRVEVRGGSVGGGGVGAAWVWPVPAGRAAGSCVAVLPVSYLLPMRRCLPGPGVDQWAVVWLFRRRGRVVRWPLVLADQTSDADCYEW